MFFHHELLSSRDSHFALIWRLANKQTMKTLQRHACLQVNVEQVCAALVDRIPPAQFSIRGTKEKFSLYLLGCLAYGTVLLYQRQMSYLEADASACLMSLKNLPLDVKLNISEAVSGKRTAAIEEPRTNKRKKLAGPDLETSADSVPLADFDALDRNIIVASMEAITLNEPASKQPFEWRENTIFGDNELPLLSEGNMQFMLGFDENVDLEHRSSNQASDKLFVTPDFHFTDDYQTIDCARPLMARTDPFIPGVIDRDVSPPRFDQTSLEQDFHQIALINEEEFRQEQEQRDDDQLLSGDYLLVGDAALTLPSVDSDEVRAEERAKAGPRKRVLLADEHTQISSAVIKKNMDSWSDLLQHRKLQPVQKKGHLSVEQLLSARPLALDSFNQCLIDCFPSGKGTLCKEWEENDTEAMLMLDKLEAEERDKVDQPLPVQNDMLADQRLNEFPPLDLNDQPFDLQNTDDAELEQRRNRPSSIYHGDRIDFGAGGSSTLEDPRQTEMVSELVPNFANPFDRTSEFSEQLRSLAVRGEILFSDVAPVHLTDAASAARRFAFLLEAIKRKEVTKVIQKEPYGDIQIFID